MSETLPPPTRAAGFTQTEIDQWHADQNRLGADPRTAGDANRPPHLVERVLKGSTPRR